VGWKTQTQRSPCASALDHLQPQRIGRGPLSSWRAWLVIEFTVALQVGAVTGAGSGMGGRGLGWLKPGA